MTDKTLEEIVKQIVITYGGVGLFVVIGVLGAVVGAIGAWLYLSKIHYKVKLNELHTIKDKNSNLESELRTSKETIAALQEKVDALTKANDDITGIQYARGALKKDTLDEAIRAFASEK